MKTPSYPQRMKRKRWRWRVRGVGKCQVLAPKLYYKLRYNVKARAPLTRRGTAVAGPIGRLLRRAVAVARRSDSRWPHLRNKPDDPQHSHTSEYSVLYLTSCTNYMSHVYRRTRTYLCRQASVRQGEGGAVRGSSQETFNR